jgi:hypothetical protein
MEAVIIMILAAYCMASLEMQAEKKITKKDPILKRFVKKVLKKG